MIARIVGKLIHGLFSPANPIGMLVNVKLLLAGTTAVGLHVRLRPMPNLTDERPSDLAWHIRAITALASEALVAVDP